MVKCRCGHTYDRHEHYHAGTYCSACGWEKCPRWRRMWIPRDAANVPLREGDPVKLVEGTISGRVIRTLSATEALIDWGEGNLSITKCVNLLLQPRDQGST